MFIFKMLRGEIMIVKLDYLYEYVPKKCVGDHEILEKFKIIREYMVF